MTTDCSHGGYAPRPGCVCRACEAARQESGDNQFPRLLASDGRYVYDFRCPACNACGELVIGKPQAGSMQCPEKCGAIFVHWQPPFKGSPTLRCLNTAQAKFLIDSVLAHGWRGGKGYRW
jgi:hypothetical protein